MDVELLVVPACPHAGPAAALLRAALDDVGLVGVAINITVVDNIEQAETRQFPGSPTMLANGLDLFPAVNRPAALACRLYAHPAGTSGLPDSAELRERLGRAAELSAG